MFRLDRDKGGVELIFIHVVRNVSLLLGKWWSKFYSNEGNLWRQLILQKYYKGRESLGLAGNRRCAK